MEDFLIKALQTGNATAILYSIAVYCIIYFQRKNSTTSRDTQLDQMNKRLEREIAELKTEKELMEKDIEFLKDENSTIKSDIKEIKNTLQQISLSLAKIAAQAELRDNKGK